MADRVSLGQDVRGIDVFPDLSDEIDRRIQHSEQRIKTWVLGGIAANLIIAITAAIPTIFYIGQMSRDIQTTQTQLVEAVGTIRAMQTLIQENTIWRARMEERQHEQETNQR